MAKNNNILFKYRLTDKEKVLETPSPPKISEDFYSKLSRFQPINKTPFVNSNSNSNNKEGKKYETPECTKKLRQLEKSGLLSKFTSLKINDIMSNEVQEQDDMKDICQVSFEERSHTHHLKSNNHQGSHNNHEDAPTYVKQICSEASKISNYKNNCIINDKKNHPRLTNRSQKSEQSSHFARRLFESQKDKPLLPKDIQSKPLPYHLIKEYVDKINDENKKPPRDQLKLIINSKPNKNKTTIEKQRLSLSESNISETSSRNSLKTTTTTTTTTNNNNNNNNNNRIGEVFRSKSQPNIEKSLAQTHSQTQLFFNSQIQLIKVNNKNYQILNCIGEGGSSKVYQVYDPELKLTLAVKVVDFTKVNDQLTLDGYKNEINLLKKLKDCQRVVRMYDYEYNNVENKLMVVMEKGDSDLAHVLKSFVDSEKSKLDYHLIRFYWKEMLKAVDEIHQHGIVHADLKPVNFILVSGKLKLIDFGIANAIQDNYTSVFKEHQIGTINYMAPEALKNRGNTKKTIIKFNCKADIWSLGCILYNLVYGITPFHHYQNLFAKATAIMDERCLIRYPPIDDPLLLDCIKLCLQRDPNKRPTAKQLLNHKYLSDNGPTSTSTSKSSSRINQTNSQHTILINKINNLTPRRIEKLSQVVEQLNKT